MANKYEIYFQTADFYEHDNSPVNYSWSFSLSPGKDDVDKVLREERCLLVIQNSKQDDRFLLIFTFAEGTTVIFLKL